MKYVIPTYYLWSDNNRCQRHGNRQLAFVSDHCHERVLRSLMFSILSNDGVLNLTQSLIINYYEVSNTIYRYLKLLIFLIFLNVTDENPPKHLCDTKTVLQIRNRNSINHIKFLLPGILLIMSSFLDGKDIVPVLKDYTNVKFLKPAF